GVAGEKRIQLQKENNVVGSAEGAYWRYESWMKQLDSDFYTVVGAAGELFSLRKTLYEPITSDVILDDFFLSMRVAITGYRFVYEPGAYAIELPSASVKEEQKRKVRICAGGFQAMKRLPQAFNIFKRPKLAFQFISHRVLRWTLTPICVFLLVIFNSVLIIFNPSSLYFYLFIAQVVFYTMAFLGYLFSLQNRKVRLFSIPYYFVFMNISVFLGFLRYRRGRQTVLWEKVRRARVEV
ncbi:MAG TPA: glycosyltransferase, partial [Candidatus Babeliaceae bacterium]|nr:glycosyltransferase [Candidatus Babeliaceae bacterium]